MWSLTADHMPDALSDNHPGHWDDAVCVRMAAGNALLLHISLRLCISHFCSKINKIIACDCMHLPDIIGMCVLTTTAIISHAGCHCSSLHSSYCSAWQWILSSHIYSWPSCMPVKSTQGVITSCGCSALLQVQEERAHCQRLPQSGAGPQ